MEAGRMPGRGGKAGGCMWERCSTPFSDLATLGWSGNRIPGGGVLAQLVLHGPAPAIARSGKQPSRMKDRRDDRGATGPLSVGTKRHSSRVALVVTYLSL